MNEASQRADWARGWRAWLLAAAFYLPMAVVVLAHLLLPPAGEWPTGFLQYDQQSYMAMAREPFDALAEGRGFSPAFGLPTSPDPETPRHYFAPHLLLLGVVQWLGDFDPGRLYLAFGAVAGLVFLRLAIALYGRVVRDRDGAALLGLACFLWGGGLFVAAGLVASASPGRLDYNSLFQFDPYGGFWLLNLGRNLFYAVESYYHAVALALLLALFDRRWLPAMLLLVLLAASHPFTGLQFLLITLAWTLLEWLLRPAADRPPLWFALSALALAALFLAYHFLLLPQSAEHRALMQQWSLSWILPLEAIALGYALVLPPAVLQCLAGGLRDRRRQLLLTIAGVSFLLANHELFISPRQPLHFTRGYDWMALFLLGAPLLVGLLRSWLAGWRRLLAAAVAGLFLLDNAAWLAVQAVQNAGGFGAARRLTAAERQTLARLDDPTYAGHLLVSADERLGYDAIAYTSLRSWYSQEHSTPWSPERLAELRAWATTGREPAAWHTRPVVFLLQDSGQDLAALPWITATSELERVEAGGQAYWLVLRPPP